MQKEVFLLDDNSATEGNLEVVDKSVAGSFHRNHNNEAVKTIFSDSQFLCHFLPLGVGNIVYTHTHTGKDQCAHPAPTAAM